MIFWAFIIPTVASDGLCCWHGAPIRRWMIMTWCAGTLPLCWLKSFLVGPAASRCMRQCWGRELKIEQNTSPKIPKGYSNCPCLTNKYSSASSLTAPPKSWHTNPTIPAQLAGLPGPCFSANQMVMSRTPHGRVWAMDVMKPEMNWAPKKKHN